MLNKIQIELKENSKQLLFLFIYTVLVAFFCSKLSPFYTVQEWSDINLYFNVSKAAMNGQTLYTETFDHKGPLTFLIYGVGYLMSDSNFVGVFIIQIINWFILISASYFTARLFLNSTYSFLTSILFLLIFISHTLQGGSAEEFIASCIAISLYLFIRYFRNPKKHNASHMYIHGILWAIAFFIKFNLVIFWVFPLLAIGCILLVQKQYKNLITNILYFLLGGLSIAAPIAIYFIYKGSLSEAIDVYFILNTSFRIDTVDVIFNKIAISFYQRLRFETLEFSIILLGAFLFPILCLRNNIVRVSIPLAFLSLFTVIFMAGYVYYYSIPYYVFASLGLITIAQLLSRFFKLKNSSILMVIATIAGLILCINRKNFFGKHDENKSETVIEKFLPTILKEKDRTLVNLGFDEANALFTYAEIMPNVKYFTSPNLHHDVYPELRNEQTKYIEEGKTMFVILTEHTNNADYFLHLEALQENYEVVDKFEEYYYWHNVNRFYYLYKRKNKVQ